MSRDGAASPVRPPDERRTVLRRPLRILATTLLACVALPLMGARAPQGGPASGTPAAGAVAFEPGRWVLHLAGSAAALRRHDCAAAERLLAAAVLPESPDGVAFRTLADGLYAHACEDVARAEDRLLAAGRAGVPELEDWRLLVLADAAAAAGDRATARRSLEELLRDHPSSPLRPQGLVEAAELAAEDGDVRGALELAAQVRAEGVGGEERQRLDELAWRLAGAAGDAAARAAAGRSLLSHQPDRAEELGVTAALAPPRAVAAAPDWAALLAPDELVSRALALLALDRPEPALAALDAVAPAARDFDWNVLSARALTAAGRGLEALWRLRDLDTSDPAAAARVDWQRARAASEAARVRRGRPPLAAEERDRLRSAGRHYLEQVGAQRADRELAARALQELFADRWDEGSFDEALGTLRRLREIDPTDTTGARKLWEAGWQELSSRNPSGAIGYWAELEALYPDSAYARGGRYWTGRAYEQLGEPGRAREIYRSLLAAETADFYLRNAAARLQGTTAATGASLADDRGIPWPVHPAFARARLLTDLGLDDLAETELLAVRRSSPAPTGAARRRAGDALEALILSRLGRPRASIGKIRDAFPALGGPFQAAVPATALRLYYPLLYDEVIRRQAERRGLAPEVVLGMVRQESGFDVGATSRAGARGLLQLMPATARETARKMGLPYSTARLSEPEFNLAVGTHYFAHVLGMFDGNLELALAGYNGGPYRIRRLWREAAPATALDSFLEGLPVEESRIYVKRILVLADSYRQLYPQATGPEPS